jgi:hypothetical protein
MFLVPSHHGPQSAHVMSQRGESAEMTSLKTRWRQWVQIVDLFACRRPARRKVDPLAYASLHKELMQNCRTVAASANAVDAVFFRYLVDLVQPWLSPTVLARADTEILLDLLVRCRQAERQLGIWSWTHPVGGWLVPMLIFSLLAFIGLLALGTTGDFLQIALDRLHVWSDDVWIAIKRTSEIERLSVVGIILIIVSIIAVSRTARS